MNSEKKLDFARKNSRDSIVEIRVALENAKEFADEGNTEQVELWRTTLLTIRDEAVEAVAAFEAYEDELAPEIDERESALNDAEGRNNSASTFEDL